MKYNKGTQSSAASMVASYGVYHEAGLGAQIEEDGFVPSANANANPYHDMVVTAAGNTTLVHAHPAESQRDNEGCGWCVSSTTISPSENSCWMTTLCKPVFLMTLLVILIVLFVLISGVLLYSNYNIYHPRHAFVEEPCEKTFCAWGAQCVIGPDGRALCQCPTYCRPHSEPVCGSDGRTYENQCQLRVASCRARINTRILHLGKCERSDPCKDKQCGFGERCVVSQDGRNASCQCPEKCDVDHGDHSLSSPVCGTDGMDYVDYCALLRAACYTKNNITVKFYGKCDPCKGIECTEFEVCQLNEERMPICKCGGNCPNQFVPICGSDGKTYINECELKNEACRTRKQLNIIYRGQCSSGVNPCKSIDCILGEECAIDKFGIARCECPPACEPLLRPVCSRDGRTYPSECELKRGRCMARLPIEIAYVGFCDATNACFEYECPFGSLCVENQGKPVCQCARICSGEFEPVCGSDGVTYDNLCKLQREECLNQKEIRLVLNGSCNECESKQCDFYSVCETTNSGSSVCVCPETCENETLLNGTVCGTDGLTYKTECDLRLTSCKTQTYIQAAYKGDCDLCLNIECQYGSYCENGHCTCPTICEDTSNEPVCASNMLTYPNECELEKASCLSQPANSHSLSILFYGDCRERLPVTGTALITLVPTERVSTNLDENDVFPKGSLGPAISFGDNQEICRDIHCDFEATCELGPDHFPRCSCQFDCSDENLQGPRVCASDFRIYPSPCAMKMEACHRQEELRLRPLDLCQGMEVKPCNGEKPIIDHITGQELNCGNGPDRQDCPTGSYCHQTTRFAKCCQKEQIEKQKEKSCKDSLYGCCPDGKTPAQGLEHLGCPSMCGCNKLGSYADNCDNETQPCKCRPGVGGNKCDRCEPGYWGLQKISSGYPGCTPCGCSAFGSVRDDCEQMTGRCVCKSGIQGQKCTLCTNHNQSLGPNGCVSVNLRSTPSVTCNELTCHFGASCIERGQQAVCECKTECIEDSESTMICGSDGQTYASACQLMQIACKLQKDIVVQAFGKCKDDNIPVTDWPMRRYTPLQFTQSDDSNSALSKSTRDLLVSVSKNYYHQKTFNQMLIGGKVKHVLPTQATIRTVTPLLGDICIANSDCKILNSFCLNGGCNCLPRFAESSDRQQCISSDQISNQSACNFTPCLHESTCVNLPNGMYTCICKFDYTGKHCESEMAQRNYSIPEFGGQSYIRLKPLKAYHKLILELEFKTRLNDGIILYNQQQEDGTGDFVSLAIVNGYVEFRYDLGNDPVIITSLDKVQLDQFHKVIVKRYLKDGMLQFDDGEDVTGRSTGVLKALDLFEDLYIGFVPTKYSRVFQNIGIDKGFTGCIKSLKIGTRQIELHENFNDLVLKTNEIHECNNCSNCNLNLNPCSSNPCLNGATCISTRHNFHCQCLQGFQGLTCEKVDSHIVDASIPQFNGSSFLQFPQLQDVMKAFTIEITFLSTVSNGLLLYNGQLRNGKGDFVSVALVRGHVQFRFNLGSGIGNITSAETITLGEWHWVRIYRNAREGTLQLDNNTLVRGYSGPTLTKLNLEMPFFIGSIRNWKEVHRLVGINKGFKGAIQRVVINGVALPISARMSHCGDVPVSTLGCGFGISIYDGLPCPSTNNPCLNGGVCIPNINNFVCLCHSLYEGLNCERLREEETLYL